MKKNEKLLALSLRKKGYSYNYILDKIKVSKSTLSFWLSDIEYYPNKFSMERISKARLHALRVRQKNKLNSIINAKKEADKYLGELSKRDLFIIGLGIYIGEGSKTQNLVRVVNSDIRVIRLMIRWFKVICGLDDSNFCIRLHLYPDIDELEAIGFWSNGLGITSDYFGKSTIDIRDNKKGSRKSLSFGTAHLTVRSNGRKEFGFFLSRKICAWMEKVLN